MLPNFRSSEKSAVCLIQLADHPKIYPFVLLKLTPSEHIE